MKLIDKAALVVEIERRIDELCNYHVTESEQFISKSASLKPLMELRLFLNTLEVKEVDLEKEIDNYICSNFFGSQTMGFFANRTKEEPNDQDIALCAKHFFELGLLASNKAEKEVEEEPYVMSDTGCYKTTTK